MNLSKDGSYLQVADNSVKNDEDVQCLQLHEITQSFSQLESLFIDFNPSIINRQRARSSICKMASFPRPELVIKFFYYCFGYNDMCLIPHITPELVEIVGSELEIYYQKNINTRSVETDPFICFENKFGISASNGCLKKIISTDTEGFINDEAISIFIDALNYHLGHRQNILMRSDYYILDSISSNNLVMLNEVSANDNNYEFPNNSFEFAANLHQQIQNGFLNKPVKTILMSNEEKRPVIIGCLNIMNLDYKHFYMFEYNYDENIITSIDPKHHPDHELKEDYKYERMWIAKTFGLMRSMKAKNYADIYCGASDMNPNGYAQEKSIKGDSSAFHKHVVSNNFPTQTDQYNCGPFTLHYIASKVFKLDTLSSHQFDPRSFRRRLLIYIVGLKYYQNIELKLRNTDVFDASEYRWLEDDCAYLHLLHFFRESQHQ